MAVPQLFLRLMIQSLSTTVSKAIWKTVEDGLPPGNGWVANGYRLPGTNTVVMDKSWTRTDAIQKLGEWIAIQKRLKILLVVPMS